MSTRHPGVSANFRHRWNGHMHHVHKTDAVIKTPKHVDRPDQLQRPRTPDLQNNRENNRKGGKWAPGKVPGTQPKTVGKTPEACQTTVFRLFGKLSQPFFSYFPGTLPGALSAEMLEGAPCIASTQCFPQTFCSFHPFPAY